MLFLPLFETFKNWVSKGKLGKCQKCTKCFQWRICNTQLRHCGKKSAKILGYMMHISQKFIIIFIKNLLKNTIMCGNSNV